MTIYPVQHINVPSEHLWDKKKKTTNPWSRHIHIWFTEISHYSQYRGSQTPCLTQKIHPDQRGKWRRTTAGHPEWSGCSYRDSTFWSACRWREARSRYIKYSHFIYYSQMQLNEHLHPWLYHIYRGIQKPQTTSKNTFILHYLKTKISHCNLYFQNNNLNKRLNERASSRNQEYLTKIQILNNT